ncbi:MAG TPA: nuclear transport factor 2 family protein [Pyrinomonadaceae bacterium]|jgi:hypothetical protein|nr:nuclear transport factor 2 family protein [Pyrinomonadaceae bacterium]
MRRALAVALVVCAALGAAAGQTNEKRSSRAGRVAEEIKRLERAWLIESYGNGNSMADYDRIVADDFTITHSNGRLLGKAEKRADILASHNPNPSPGTVFRIDEASVRVRVYDDAAVSTGHIIEKYSFQGRDIDDRVHFTNTYLRRRGRWQVVASQLTRVRQQPRQQ